MERNHILAFALSIGVILIWMSMQESPRRAPAGTEAPGAEESIAPTAIEPPGLSPDSLDDPLALQTRSAIADPGEPEAATDPGEIIEIDKPLYQVELGTRGAGIRKWSLKTYLEGPRKDRRPVVLTTGQDPMATAVATPFKELGLGNLNHAIWEVAENDGTQLVFRMTRDGVTLRKIYRFGADSYDFEVEIQVENASKATVAPRFVVEWPAHTREGQDFREQGMVAVHDGKLKTEALSGGGPMACASGGDGNQPLAGNVDFVGVQNTYFLSALFPDEPAEASALLATRGGGYGMALLEFPPVSLPPGQAASRVFRGYVGPKEVERLEALGDAAVHAVDVGWSWISPMTHFFSWMLRVLYSFIPNYGVAIVILTILVKLVTAPLVAKQMRSMEAMRSLQPKLKELQAKHKDDKQKQSEAMMALYKSEGVNPLGGCLPMVLQLPVMIGLFYALRSSIELREAPFFGWITDLSAPETLFVIPGLDLPVRVLPLIMGATMVLQQRMTPQPSMDPAQARMMTTVMPIVMTVVFYQFASGLVLYWMLSNMLAIAQQLWIRRSMAK